ncbi:MAG: hypothetical protein KBT47_04620 [Armatimonadetes bacterium]|nr:hypothetical protein [Candidatus Hippobium faecium]
MSLYITFWYMKMKNLTECCKKLILIFAVVVLAITACSVMPVFADEDFRNIKETYEVKAIGSLFNLGNGGILADSEFVYLNGERLDKSKSEYSIDYGAAVLIINRLMNLGDRVDVDYCYVPGTAKTAPTTAGASVMPKFQYTSGNTITDMTMMYNAIDATTGNATYGTNFKTTFGSNFTIDSNFYKSIGDGGQGDFNLHNLSYKNNGLDISLGYQKSSEDFSGMNYVIGQGNDGGLAGERGLERVNFGLNYAFGENSALRLGYNTVGDGNDKIANTDLAYSNSKLNFTYSTQDIGLGFTRFNDIREADKGVLAAERGMSRENMALGYDFGVKGGKINYAFNSVSDGVGSIKNTSLNYSNSKLNLSYSTQNIDREFTRFNDIREADKAVLAGERGMDRTNFALAYDFGIKGGKINFSQNGIDYNDSSILTKMFSYDSAKIKYNFYNRKTDSAFGNFNGLRDGDKGQIAQESGIERTTRELLFDIGKTDAVNWQTFKELSLETENGKKLEARTYNVNYNNFEGQFFTLKNDSDFDRMNALNGDERNMFSGFARKLFSYGQGAGNADDADRNSWYGQGGIDRKMSFLKYNINPESNVTYTDSRLSMGNGAGLSSVRLNYAGKYKGQNTSFYYYKDSIDRDFSRLGNLTNIERANYNNMYGMNNLNYGLEGTFGFGYLKYTDNKIDDDVTGGKFNRRYMAYAVPKYTFAFTDTKIDDSFSRIWDISDGNRETYAGWKGFDRKEYVANMKFGSATKVFDVNSYIMIQDHEFLDNRYSQNSLTVNYVPDARFNASYYSNSYRHENENNYDIDNKETVLKMNKLLNIGKLTNNTFYAMYRTNSFLSGTEPVNQKFVDLSYKTDGSAKFIMNLDYNIAEYSETDKRKGFDLYATQKITDKFGLTFGMGETTYLDADKEKRIKYGVTYSVNDSFSMAYNIDKIVKGNDHSRDNSSFVIQGKLPKLFGSDLISDLSANFKYDLNKASEVRQAYNDNYGFSANILKGAFSIERSSVLDAETKSWYNDTSKIAYKNDNLFGSNLSVEFVNQSTTNAATKLAGDTSLYKFNYTLNNTLTAGYVLNKGAWNENRLVPIRSEEFSLTKKIMADKNLSLKYTQNRNSLTNMDERIWALSFDNGGTKQKGKFNVYAGLVSSYKINSGRQTTFTYTLEYEYMLSKENFLSVLASKTTDVKQTNVEDYVTDTIGLDYRQNF